MLASDAELVFLTPTSGERGADIVLRLSGLRVAGAELPGLHRADETALATRNAQLPTEEWYRGPGLVIHRTGDELLVRFHDGTSFAVSGDGREIALVAAPAEYTRDDLAAYALGPVIAIALHLQGAVLLHAAAVVMRGKAVLFAGAPGSGKSTTAAILHRQGYAVLADDVTEIAGSGPWTALASAPAMRLWPDALHALFGSAAAFPDRAPSWDKKLVLVEPASGAEVGAIIFLEGRGAAARLEPVAPRDAWLRLTANIYTAMLPGDDTRRAIFDATAALADRVPTYALTSPPLDSCMELGAFLERELAEALQ